MVSIDFHSKKTAGPKDSNEPRLAGTILHDYLENGSEPLPIAYRQHLNSRKEVVL